VAREDRRVGITGATLTLCSISVRRLVQVPRQWPKDGEAWGEGQCVNTFTISGEDL